MWRSIRHRTLGIRGGKVSRHGPSTGCPTSLGPDRSMAGIAEVPSVTHPAALRQICPAAATPGRRWPGGRQPVAHVGPLTYGIQEREGSPTLLTTATSHATARICWSQDYDSSLFRASSSTQLRPELIRSIRSVQAFSSRWIRAAPDSPFLNQVRAISRAIFEVDSA